MTLLLRRGSVVSKWPTKHQDISRHLIGWRCLSSPALPRHGSNFVIVLSVHKVFHYTAVWSTCMMTSSNWEHLPHYWPFVRGIHRSPVNSPHKGPWRGALMFSLICARINGWVKQSWGWWFEAPLRSLWRHCNDIYIAVQYNSWL